jgi:hypothetical protein
MGTRPEKRTGFNQGIYATSATKKETVGTPRRLADGRGFVYAKAGAALTAGNLNMCSTTKMEVIETRLIGAVMNRTFDADYAIGVDQVTVVVANSSYAENYFADGFLQINDTIGQGLQYGIESSPAKTLVAGQAVGVSMTISLKDKIRVAITATSECTLAQNPQMGVYEIATRTCPAGVPPVAVTADYYFWNQRCGIASVLMAAGNTDVPNVPGVKLTPSAATAGAVVAGTAYIDHLNNVGTLISTTSVPTEYKTVMLNLPL